MFGNFFKSCAVAAGLTAVSAGGAMAITVSQLDVLLTVDLTTENQITISATDGNSAETISGSDTTGVYLDQFFAAAFGPVEETFVSGNLTAAANPSDGTPGLFTTATPDTGLNIFSMAVGDLDFTAGQTAFSGSATWDLNAASYQAALAGNMSGLLYFPADDISDLGSATVIGEWERVAPVPLPAALPLLLVGLAGMGVVARRRTT